MVSTVRHIPSVSRPASLSWEKIFLPGTQEMQRKTSTGTWYKTGFKLPLSGFWDELVAG